VSIETPERVQATIFIVNAIVLRFGRLFGCFHRNGSRC
jgi:hypothetical protein